MGFLRRHGSLLVRLGVCAAALAYISYKVNWHELALVWHNADARLMLLGLLAFGPAPVLIAIRLKWLLETHDIRVRTWPVIKVTFAGNFIINALPVGTSGGDAAKAFYIAKDTPRKHEAVTTVFFDRVIGVVGLVLTSGLMALLNWSDPAFTRWGRVIALLTVALFAGGAVYYSGRLRRLFRLDAILARLPLGKHIQRIDNAVLEFRNDKARVLAAVLLAILLQAVAIFSLFLAGWALGAVGDSPWRALPIYFAYIPICFLTGAFPIGVMEATFIELFSTGPHPLGSQEAAVFLSLVARLIQLIWALPGGLVVLRGMPVPSQSEIEPAST